MKAVIISLTLFLVIVTLVGIHSYVMFDLAEKLSEKGDEITRLVNNSDWDNAIKALDQAKAIWDNRRIWAALTISTNDIEELEISFKQSRAYATLHKKEDFFGEFIMFTSLAEHITHREGFSIEEIL